MVNDYAARAVASNLGGNGCLYTLGSPSSAVEGVALNGPAVLNASSCGIVDNGIIIHTGGTLTLNADTIAVAGSSNVSGGGGSVTCSSPGPCPATGTPAATDPLSGLTPPCTSCSGGNAINVVGGGISAGCGPPGCSYSGGTHTISPGTYCSITIHGAASDHVVFSPGVYIIDGSSAPCSSASLKIPGNDTITGTGVTFYFTNNSTLIMNGIAHREPNGAGFLPGTYPGILMVSGSQ